MLAVLPCETIENEASSSIPFPLPLPEKLHSHDLANCLVAITPMIECARDRVRRGIRNLAIPFDPVAIEESLAANLTQPLIHMTAQVMVLELNVARLEGLLAGNTPQERFFSFLSRLREPEAAAQLLYEYPGLRKQIVNHLDRWSDSSLEFLKHFCDDWPLLRKEFFNTDPGPLTEVQGGAGDTHRGGRSVMILKFASGARLVYKPRSLAVDEHFQNVLAWLNEQGVEPPFRLLKVLDRTDHGWSEFITAASCGNTEEVARFYRRQGSYLAILHTLEASDCHCENLIAAGEHPLLVDLEALFHRRPRNATSVRADEIAGTALGSSVLGVGLLPLRVWAREGYSGIDISGLGSAAGALTPYGVPHWDGAGTDQMHRVRKRKEIPGAQNRPTLEGREVNAFDYAESIATGFASTYRLLLAHQSEITELLQRFSGDEVRVVARATHTYATLFQESFHPDLLRDESNRISIFDRLREITDNPALEKLIPAERQDLMRGDIPFFTTRPGSRHLRTSMGEIIENYFDESGLGLVRRRICLLSEEDLERQLWIVRASIATLDSSKEGGEARATITRHARKDLSAGDNSMPQQMILAARAVGDRIQKLAFRGHDDASWIGLVQTDDHAWSLSPLGPDLYDGLPGVMLFLGYLGWFSGDGRYSTLAAAALKTLRRQIEQNRTSTLIGAFSGWGGIIYSLTHLGALWGDPSLYAEAESLLGVVAKCVPRDKVRDVIGGAAGCVLALRSLHRVRPSARLLKVASACGEHLLLSAQPMERGIGWICGSMTKSPLTGFAHGNAGIAYSLFELAEMTGESRFKAAALRALEYERSLFSPEQGNWPDLRAHKSSGFAMAWCHGAPGIALSRLCSLRHVDDAALNQEIHTALASTLSQGFGGNQSLCHGDLGNADILLSAAEFLGQPGWRFHANHAAAAAAGSVCENGWICGNPLGVESPGLMTGLAGIGYTFLRFADPARIPSVLSLDPPVMQRV